MEETEFIKINIFGTDYNVKRTKDSAYIKKVADFVDKKMQEISSSSQIASSTKIAVLAAMNISDELHKLKDKDGFGVAEENVRIKKMISRLEEILKE